MAINIETAINHMYTLKSKGIRYSMNHGRIGEDGTGDCSGTIYASLRKAGATDAGWVLNTDSMHSWLEKNGFKLIAQNKEWTAERGDIVIFGKKGASGGAAGHVVIFVSNTQIIHCTWKSAAANGIYVDNEATTCPYDMGWYVYRLGNAEVKPPIPPKGNLEMANINCGAYHIIGKLAADKKDTPFVFFLDKNKKEITRRKGIWNGDKVEFGGNTPLNVIGKKFTLMFRASDDKGDKSIVEVAFPNAFELPLISEGHLDETQPVGGKLRLTGWHLATKQQASDRHFLILMDKATNNELTRFDVTADSFKQSADVKQHYVDGRIAQAVNCRFDTTVAVGDKFNGKKTYIISRYCADAKGDRDIRDDKKYDDVLIFL